VNAAANQGVSNSSAAQGGIGSIQSQLSSNVSFLDNFNLISDQASAKLGEMRKHEAKAAAAKARTSLVLKGGLFALGL
jgi:hypothetical protein